MVNNQPLNQQPNDEQSVSRHPASQLQIWGSVVVIGLMLLISLYAGTQLPAGAKIPVHWNAVGEVDRYGGRFEGLYLLPLITAGLVLLFYALPWLDPRGENIRRSGKAYRVLWMVMLLFFLVLHSAIMLSVLGAPINMTQAILAAMGLMFMLLGNYMGKIRRNYLMGIRTPWTLDSDAVWDKTHRLGGKLFLLSGLLTLLAGLLLTPMQGFIVLGISMGITVAVSVGYSYWLWKQEAQNR